MSKRNSLSAHQSRMRGVPLTVLALCLLGLSGNTSSEMTPKNGAPAAAKTRPTTVESMARIRDDSPRSLLRCWQEGRLIFESQGMLLSAKANTGSPPMLKAADGRSVQILDLRQGFCVLEQRG